MKYLVWMIGLFAAAVALVMVSHHAGYVLIVYPPYRVELSLILFVMLSLLALALFYVLMRFTNLALNIPNEVRQFRERRVQAKTRAIMDEVLAAYFEGRYAVAQKAAVRAIESGETSALYAIIAARSAHELREYDKRDNYLSGVGGKSVGDATLRLMATTKFMLDQRNPQAALGALQELQNSGVTGHEGALSLELRAQQQAGNWDGVLDALEQLEKRRAIDHASVDPIRQQAWLGKIHQQSDLNALVTCLKYMPIEYRLRARVAAEAVRALLKYSGHQVAGQLISDSLDAQWDSDLVALYGDCHTDDVIGQIDRAEKWLKQHDQDAGLLLALGKLCVQQKLWGKAQNYLEASISIRPGYAAYTALGQLTERLGNMDEARKYAQRASELSRLDK